MERILKIEGSTKTGQWNYDGEADVLYLSPGEPEPAEGVDIGRWTDRPLRRTERRGGRAHRYWPQRKASERATGRAMTARTQDS